jgi:hypothetical protein
MIEWKEFRKWFNRDFWRAFKNRTFPIRVPNTPADRDTTVRQVYDAIVSARYAASIPEAEIIANKGHGVARTIPVFCIEDYIVYYFCIKQLEDVLCGNRTANTFGGWTLGGKFRRLEDEDVEYDFGPYISRYSFNPRAWTVAFGEFNSLLYAQLDSDEYSHILQFDLTNFYDCVRLDTLERSIREEADSSLGWVIALLFYFLNQWNRRNTGLHPQAVGLPQDALADCSRILANYYLQRYDKVAARVCTEANAAYFRYSDDQMILLKSADHCESIMLQLTRNLDRYGLRVNQKKVQLWTKSKLEAHRCRRIHVIFAREGSNKNPDKVREFAAAYLGLSNKKLAATWNGGFPLLNRLLWANIESLPQTELKRLLSRYLSPDFLLRAESEKLVRVYRLAKLQGKSRTLVKRLRKLGTTSVHNAFHYEVLGFATAIEDKELMKVFQKRVTSLAKQMLSSQTKLPR